MESPVSSITNETYVFERMWPVLPQPWYFNRPFEIAIDDKGFVYVADSYNNRIHKFTQEGVFLTKWGSWGNGDGEFKHPYGLTVDSSGFVYVADFLNHRIQKFTPEGGFVTKWGSEGCGDGQFNRPWDIAVDNSGFVYVADSGNHRIQKFTQEGEFIAKWGSEGSEDGWFEEPHGIAVDGGGFVYVADSGNHRIQKFTQEGEVVEFVQGREGREDGQFNNPSSIAVDNNGFLYVADTWNRRIQKFTPEGGFKKKWGGPGSGDGQLDNPYGIAVSGIGFVYVVDTGNGRIQIFTQQGVFVTKWWTSGSGDGQFASPRGIALDSSGFVYVADSGNHRIQKFTQEGWFVTKWGSYGSGNRQFASPGGIEVDNNGFLYVADSLNHRIQKFTQEGEVVEFVTEWGKEGNEEGQFDYPNGIAVDSSGFVYVADTFNHRIQKFTPEGGFVTKWGSWGTWDGQFDWPYGIAVDSSGFLYVADTFNHRIQKFTPEGGFVTKWGSDGSRDGQFKHPYDIAIDSSGFVYVADTWNSRIQKFTSEGAFITKFGQFGSESGRLNWPHGIAIGQEGRIYISDTANKRIQVFTNTLLGRIQKAIICAGGGPYIGNSLWEPTRIWANFAYNTLTNHGFTREGIYYLTSDTGIYSDPNDPIEVDGSPSKDTLEYAITEWAADPHTMPMWAAVQNAVVDDVIIYLIDHGGENTFRLNESEMLYAHDLDQWLFTLQEKISGSLILIIDSCQSGSFIRGLTSHQAGDRIIITSTSPDERAVFASNGSISFSSFFWTGIMAGSTPKEAFDRARDAMEHVPHSQHPLLDDNGNHQGNDPNDGVLAEGIYIGTKDIIWDSNAPVIGNAEVLPRPAIPNSAVILAENVTDSDGVDRVWAIITPPGYTQGMPNRSVTKLPEVTLMPYEYEDIRYYMGIYPKFNTPGQYTISLYAIDEKLNRSRPKNIPFNYADYDDPLRVRAVILAGETSERLSPAIRHNISLAYKALTFQGYDPDDIYILCSPALSHKSNASPSLQGLDYAISTWAANNTKELLLYLTGEGDTSGLRINSTDTLSATVLDTWLDHLQRDTNAIVTLIYDATSSGDFLPYLIPPEGRKRIVITSTKGDQPAHFLFEGILSFSSFLWGAIINGENLEDAFLYAAGAIGFTSMRQAPMLDDNGDGKGYIAGSDGTFAKTQTIGYGFAVADDVPIIGRIMPEQYLDEDTNALIWVDDVTSTGSIDSVWCIITPPDYRPDSTVTELPRVELLPSGGGRYEEAYNGFSEKGLYTLTVYAMDPNKNISLPKKTKVYQLGNDDSPEEANSISLDESPPQPHIFNRPGDQDWVRFYGIGDEIYEIKIKREIDSNAWVPLFEIYESDGVTLVEPPISWPWIRVLTWQCPKTDVYYIRIWSSVPDIYGEGTQYDLSVFPPYSFDGTIKGVTRDACSGLPVMGALISASIEGRPGGGSDISRSEGSYRIPHPSGYCNIRVEREGYHTYVFSGLYVKRMDPTIRDIKLQPYALCLSPGVHKICYPVPVPVESDQKIIDSYDLLLRLGSPDEVASINRPDMDPNGLDRIESTFYLFGRPSGARFPITEEAEYLIHMKKERVIYHCDLP